MISRITYGFALSPVSGARLRALVILTGLGATLAMSGCGTDSEPSRPLQGRASVRILHALTGVAAGGVTVTLDNASALAATNLPLGGVTSYQAIPPGTLAVTVAPSGADALVNQGVAGPFDVARRYTVIIRGDAGQAGGSAAGPGLSTIPDEFPVLTSTQSALRIVHQATGLDSVDLYTTSTPPAPTGAEKSVPLAGASNVSYGNASTYQIVPSGSLKLEVYDHLTGKAVPTRSLARAPQLYLNPGMAYTVLVLGKKGTTEDSVDAVDAMLLPDDDRTDATKYATGTPAPTPAATTAPASTTGDS
ncbi:MAG: DUF4397 domain-containing protein [Armatimonas sp.]